MVYVVIVMVKFQFIDEMKNSTKLQNNSFQFII